MKSLAAIFILSLLLSCLPKKTKIDKPGASPAATQNLTTPTQNGSLIGSWWSCESYPQGEIIGIKSSSIVYAFKDEKTMSMSAEYYADDQCRTQFTRTMADDYFKHYEDLNKAPAPEDVKQSVIDLAEGIHQEIPYTAQKVPAGEVGIIDFLSLERPSYTSYRIWDDKLQIANVCQDLVEEGCEPIGDKPSNRATDINEGDILSRQK